MKIEMLLKKQQKQVLLLKRKHKQKEKLKMKSNGETFLFIDHYAGFGNYIFDLIIAYYFKKYVNKKVYVVEYCKNFHHEGKIEWLHVIFPLLKDDIHFITKEESIVLRKENEIKGMKEKEMQKMKNNLQKNIKNYSIQIFTCRYYPWVYNMFSSFHEDDKNKFMIDSIFLNEKYQDILKEDFTGIHIRYGDKLFYGINKKNHIGNSFMSFPIYTPEYYHEQIKKMIEKNPNEKIYLFTDSVSIVQKYLYEKFEYEKYPNIQIMDIPFLDTFYILIYAKKFIMSHSTFSYAIYLLRKRKEQECIICTIKDLYKIYKSYDCFIHPKWNVIHGKQYILNFQQEKIKNMYEYSKKKIELIQTNEINEIIQN